MDYKNFFTNRDFAAKHGPASALWLQQKAKSDAYSDYFRTQAHQKAYQDANRDYYSNQQLQNMFRNYRWNRGSAPSSRSSRSSKSRTRTMTKTTKKRKSRKPKGGRRWVKKWNRQVKNVVKYQMSAPQHFVTTFIGRLAASQNTQIVAQLTDMFGTADIADMGAGIQQFSGTNAGRRFEVQKWSQHYLFHNQTNTNVRLTLWECVSRYDSPAIAGGLMSPATLLTQSLLDSKATGSVNTMAPTTFGFTPYMADRFTALFRIKKPTVIELNAGSQATYVFKSRRRKTINFNRYYNGATALINGEAGFYTVLLYGLHGYPCNDAATKTNIALSEAAVDFIMKEKAIVSSNIYQNFPTYAYQQAAAFSATATPTIMSEASGTGQTVVSV